MSNLLSFIRRFRDNLRLIRLEREQKERAMMYVSEHSENFLGKNVEAIEEYCGQYDSFGSFDFGDWGAQWRTPKLLLSVYIKNDLCVDITLIQKD